MARHLAKPRPATIAALKSRYFPWIGGVALTGCAALSFPGRPYVLVGLMLFFPLLDRGWKPPSLPRRPAHLVAWLVLLLTGVLLVLWRPESASLAATTLVLAAIPEEWFFRAYFQTALGTRLQANLLTSLLFALLHVLAWRSPTMALVFFPSLFYGWLYDRTRDLPLLVLVHALSNLVFALFLADWFSKRL